MKNINYLNYFFVGVPAIPFVLAFFHIVDLIIFSMLFSILTGLFQVTIGGSMLIDEPRDKSLQCYIMGVFLYFVILCVNPFLPEYFFKTYILFGMPAILALLLTVIIHKKANK